MGRIPIEAGAYGKPTIALAVGGLPEVVRHGVTDWLVPAGDFEALRDSMEQFLLNGSAGFGAAARDWVVSTFDPRAYVGRLRSIYDDVLRRGPQSFRRSGGA